MVEVSLDEFDRLYAMLGSALTRADVVGESAYNDDLQAVVDDLRKPAHGANGRTARTNGH